MVSMLMGASESKDMTKAESKELVAEAGEVGGDLRLRGLVLIMSGGSVDPSLCSFCFLASSTPCISLQFLVTRLASEESRDWGTFATAVRVLFLVSFAGAGPESLSQEDSPDVEVVEATGPMWEGPKSVVAGASVDFLIFAVIAMGSGDLFSSGEVFILVISLSIGSYFLPAIS